MVLILSIYLSTSENLVWDCDHSTLLPKIRVTFSQWKHSINPVTCCNISTHIFYVTCCLSNIHIYLKLTSTPLLTKNKWKYAQTTILINCKLFWLILNQYTSNESHIVNLQLIDLLKFNYPNCTYSLYKYTVFIKNYDYIKSGYNFCTFCLQYQYTLVA